MKKILKLVPLIALGSLFLLLPACSNSHVRIGTDYKNNKDSDLQGSAFSSTIYVFFSDHVVSVYKEISAKGDIARLKSNETLQSSSDRWDLRIGAPKGASLSKGTDETTSMEVLFGPGDRMPVLEYATYKIEGTSIYIDWSQHHSEYFALSSCSSGSEVFTIKNDGLVLESATSPGFTLTLDASGKSHALSSTDEKMNQLAVDYQEQSRIAIKREQEAIKRAHEAR
jgi:hypothetical protein